MEVGIPLVDLLQKMNNKPPYDVAIIGGGLAGLCLSIQLARSGKSVILFEKESYPFHKVCGEYISMESWDFLIKLGLPLDTMQLPLINKLLVSSPDGTILKHDLPLGGFGISRFTIDNALKEIAVHSGVEVKEKTKTEDVLFSPGQSVISTNNGQFNALVCCGSFGKRSNLDIKWKRPFTRMIKSKLDNFIGIKYHIRTDFPADCIALHNFENGYCGISRIEDDRYCLCYLTTAANLKACDNSIQKMEETILSANPHLKKLLSNSVRLYESPLSISQVSFNKRSQVEDHVLLLGDAAGLIAPLCGNGMSMAMHASRMAAKCISDFLEHKITREIMEEQYTREWNMAFSGRLRAGRWIQRFFGKPWTTNLFIRIMKRLPFLTTRLIRLTHGKPF